MNKIKNSVNCDKNKNKTILIHPIEIETKNGY